MAPARTQLEQIKKATVAIAVMHEPLNREPSRKQPFTIIGSGFCVHERGIVITCSHVIEAFLEKKLNDYLDSIPPEEKSKSIQNIPELRSLVPHALFYIPQPDKNEIHVITARVEMSVGKTNMDLGALRLHPHSAFPQGYPTLQAEVFEELHEGMEIATCGFPLGNLLFDQLGTITSSFTRGIISSMIPSQGASRKDVTAFQLDLRATHGNSGGPVFSWSTGRVFGVLQSGVDDQYGHFLFSRAESIYRLIDDGVIDDLLIAKMPPAF